MSDNEFFPENPQKIDIVDAQYHLGKGQVETTLAAMDALGIRSLLIDEFWGEFGTEDPTHIQPGYRLNNGAWRAAIPTAELASLTYPDRFSYLIRIDRKDPDLEHLMIAATASPHARAFRLQPTWNLEEVSAFASGAYDGVFEMVEDLGLPIFIFLPGYAELLAPYARKFPKVNFVIDHCGMGFPNIPSGRPQVEASATLQPSYLDVVLRLAEFPNVALKWSHAQNLLGAQIYPYESLRPLLRKAIDAFGEQRLAWASDSSVIPNHTWADMLFSLRDDSELSRNEKEWLLGRTARRILNWPSAEGTH